jgi:hypothetical protein
MTSSQKQIDTQRPEPAADEAEDSGVFVSRSLLVLDVAIGALRAGGLLFEPVPIYATPFVRSGKDRIRYARDYCVGVRFPTGVIAADGWEAEMIRDGMPAFVIDRCRAYLAEHAL